LAISAKLRHTTESQSAGGKQVDRRVTAGLRWLWSNQGIMRMVLFCTVLNLVGAAMGLTALVVLTEHGTSAGVIGFVVGWSGSGVILGSLIATRAMALGRWLYPLVGLLWAGSLASIAVSSSPWAVGLVLTFLAFLGPSIGVMMFQILRDQAPMQLYGRVVAAQQLMGTSLATAAPLLAGVLLAVFGTTQIWLVLAGTCLVATVLTLRGWATGDRAADEPAAQTPAQTPAKAPAVVAKVS
jgi:hypothetical protein